MFVEEIWLSFDRIVVDDGGVTDDNDDALVVVVLVVNLFNERRVSGKFGGVAGVFAGVINWFKSNNYILNKNKN